MVGQLFCLTRKSELNAELTGWLRKACDAT